MDRADTVAIMAAILFGKVERSTRWIDLDHMHLCVSRAADLWDIAAERNLVDQERAYAAEKAARLEQAKEEEG